MNQTNKKINHGSDLSETTDLLPSQIGKKMKIHKEAQGMIESTETK